jgi:hypothetical protein
MCNIGLEVYCAFSGWGCDIDSHVANHYHWFFYNDHHAGIHPVHHIRLTGDLSSDAPLTEIWEVWVLSLPVELRGLSSYVGTNVEILCEQDLGISDSRKVCRKLCRDFVSTGEFCKGNNNHNLCASSHPRVREDELHCKSVSRYYLTI